MKSSVSNTGNGIARSLIRLPPVPPPNKPLQLAVAVARLRLARAPAAERRDVMACQQPCKRWGYPPQLFVIRLNIFHCRFLADQNALIVLPRIRAMTSPRRKR